MTGAELPALATRIPGPLSRQLAERLRRVESPNITAVEPEPPIFWEEARGANVRDVDGNVYIDLTAGFGVSNAGHSHPDVAQAIGAQAQRLAHAMGDVYPAEIKVRLLERLTSIMPGALAVSILGNTGAEAVEAALKTAVVHTGRTGVLAFRNAYHGLSYGALSVTQRSHFRHRFEPQLFAGVQFATFPEPAADRKRILDEIDDVLARSETSPHPIGCIIAEPVQGRGGIRVPPDWFLPELRARCNGRTRILILDEIYTGIGRTGRWLACEHWSVLPDIAVIGKGLTGTLPLSAAVGTRAVMRSWPDSAGEAIHTSTFLGNPVACAAALAQIDVIEQNRLLERALELGERIRERTAGWRALPGVRDTRGLGLLQAIPLDSAERARRIVDACLQSGVLLLVEGPGADVLAITPPAVITETQLNYALEIIEQALIAEH